MTPTEEILLSRYRARAAGLTPDIVAEILAVYEAIRRLLTEAELAEAIADGGIYALIDEITGNRLPQDPAAARLRALLGRTGLESARQAARDLPAGLAAGFDTLNPAVITAARDLQTRVMTTLTDETRATLVQAATDGLAAGQNPRAIAVRMVDDVGLPPHYARAVDRFREQLESGDRAALRRTLRRGVLRDASGNVVSHGHHAGGKGLTARQMETLRASLGKRDLSKREVDLMVESYRRRLKAWNAETLARSAAIDAQRKGQRATWEDAIARGMVDRERLRKRWRTTLDGRERPEHHALNGKTAGFDEPFPNGEITPGSSTYNCRCIALYFLGARRQAVAA